ncbi:MAG: trypsin-like peptidase domain-containing protein [Litorimonas sp.]
MSVPYPLRKAVESAFSYNIAIGGCRNPLQFNSTELALRPILTVLIPLLTLTSSLTLPISAAAQSNSAISYDASRNVFTMAPTIQKVTPGVVSISTIDSEEADGSTIGGIGSGVIIDAQAGLILTNDHVIEDAQSITVILSDKRRYRATVRGQDPETDLALLEITATNLTALPVSSSDDVQVGDIVIAVGNPFGLSHSVSTGIVSAIGRTDDNPLGYSDLIQTDAAINPGNSGGALVNSAGELIGINSALVSKQSGGGGIGFAIPAHTFRAVAAQLQVYGQVSRGSLGVMISPVTQDAQARLNLPHLNGAHIVEVTQNGAGFAAGLQVDDVVTWFGGREIGNSSDLRYAVGLVRPDTVARLTYIRDGSTSEVDVIVRELGYFRTANVNFDAASIN